jgi:CRISPR-associated endonuclease/helicase Cas3
LIKDRNLRIALQNNLRNNFKELLKEETDKIIEFNDDLADYILKGDLAKLLYIPYYFYYLPKRLELNNNFKLKWILLSGSLMRIDHFVSYIQDENINENIDYKPEPYEIVKNRVIGILNHKNEDKEINAKKYWQFDIVEENKDKNLILIAPTGSGKTEFAFLWGSGNKIIFTLPLRAASNAVFKRAKEIFIEKNTGLLHSDADIYLFRENMKNNELTSNISDGDNIRIIDMSKQLALSTIITTGDQIFPSALKFPGYERLYAILCNSRLVIDEVQAYDPKAAAIVVKLIEDISLLGGKFLLMTATLPNFIREEIEKRIDKNSFKLINLYGDELKKLKKHKIILQYKDVEDKEIINEIIKKASIGKRVLVILNTIKKAQEIFKKIKTDKENNPQKFKNITYIEFLHSRFTNEDRLNKETRLQSEGYFKNPKPKNEIDGKILISTQIVEASLDIDADCLFTEICPADALIQRMGRILRRYRSNYIYDGEPNVFVLCRNNDELDKNKAHFESGKGRVYENTLIIRTLLILLEKMGIYKKDNIQISLRTLEEMLNKANTVSPLLISEYDKNYLVDNLYDTSYFVNLGKEIKKSKKAKKEKEAILDLNIDNYLKEFGKTLDILDAGYSSENRHDASRLFREIYSIDGIPINIVEEFCKDVSNFISDDNINYTNFKQKVMSRNIINVDLRKYFNDNHPQKAINNINIMTVIENISSVKIRNKIKSWLEDIYIFDDLKYDNILGATEDKSGNIENNGMI